MFVIVTTNCLVQHYSLVDLQKSWSVSLSLSFGLDRIKLNIDEERLDTLDSSFAHHSAVQTQSFDFAEFASKEPYLRTTFIFDAYEPAHKMSTGGHQNYLDERH